MSICPGQLSSTSSADDGVSTTSWLCECAYRTSEPRQLTPIVFHISTGHLINHLHDLGSGGQMLHGPPVRFTRDCAVCKVLLSAESSQA